MALDGQQNIWVAGTYATSMYTLASGGTDLGDTFVVELDPTLSNRLASQSLPYGTGDRGFTLGLAGEQILLGSPGSLLELPATGAGGTTVLGLSNAAAYTVSTAIAPGELISIYGTGLGPNPGAGSSLNSSGQISSTIGGTRILIGGVAAPLLYAGPNQINAVVPFEVASVASTTIQVVTASGGSESFPMSVASAVPELISEVTDGVVSVIALNQDGSLNFYNNPALAGSVVVFYAFGAGALSPPLQDAAIAGDSLSYAANPVSILLNGVPLKILYAGSAPGIVAGVMQINAQLPTTGIMSADNVAAIQVNGVSGRSLAIGVQP